MSISQLFQEGLIEFKDKLGNFMIDKFKTSFGADWINKTLNPDNQDSVMTNRKNPESWDLVMLINLVHVHWDTLFKHLAKDLPRSIFTLIKTMRNMWAHQQDIGAKEAYRTFDAMVWVLESFEISCAKLEKSRMSLVEYMYKHRKTRISNSTKNTDKTCSPNIPNNIPYAPNTFKLDQSHPTPDHGYTSFLCPGCNLMFPSNRLYVCPYHSCKACVQCVFSFWNAGNSVCPICNGQFSNDDLFRLHAMYSSR